MKYQQLVCFREVAETQSFTQAAKNMYIAQPGVSYNIRTLEKELGVSLFERDFNSKNRSVLTEYGMALREPLTEAIDIFEDAESAMVRMRENQERRMTIALSGNLLPGAALEIHEGILEQCRDSQIHFETRLTGNEVEEEIRRGVIHLAIYPERTEQETLECEALFRMPLYAYLPASYPFEDGQEIHLSELADYPLISPYNARKQMAYRILRMEEAGGTPLRRSAIQSRYMNERLLYVTLDMGYTVGAAFSYNPAAIKRVSLCEEDGYMYFYMIWDAGRKMTKEHRKVMRVLRRMFEKNNILE